MKLHKDQSGIAHLAAIIIVVLIAGLGFAGWRVYDGRKGSSGSQNNSTTKQSDDTADSINASSETQQSIVASRKLGECVDFRKDAGESLEEGELKQHLTSQGFKVYSVTQRCNVSDGSQLVSFKLDDVKLPPALVVYANDKEVKPRSTQFDCRALGGEGAHLIVEAVIGANISVTCSSGHMGQTSAQSFEVNYNTLEKKLTKDVQN